jgi:hypothetical protein
VELHNVAVGPVVVALTADWGHDVRLVAAPDLDVRLEGLVVTGATHKVGGLHAGVRGCMGAETHRRVPRRVRTLPCNSATCLREGEMCCETRPWMVVYIQGHGNGGQMCGPEFE